VFIDYSQLTVANNHIIISHIVNMSNQAAWLMEAKANPLVVKEAPMPKAGKGEVVVKNHAVAVNPVDCEYCHI
jgi:hypothetical protein